MAGPIRVGIGGWTYEPWRGTFYPEKLPQARELEHAANAVTAIEINGTYYSSFKAASFEKWAKAAPVGFKFSVKASRFCTNRKVLADAGDSITKFLGQGLTALGDKLGPILWQFMATKKFDPQDFGAFLDLLPESKDGLPLRHAIEVRHESFVDAEFVAMARKAGAAIVFADKAGTPSIADLTGDFVYARLQAARDEEPTGYDSVELDRWTRVAKNWADGQQPDGLNYVAERHAATRARETYVFFINGAKVRAPAAAQAMIARLG